MFRRPAELLRAGALLALAAPLPAAAAEARFEVGGAVTPGAETLSVRVDLRNTGDIALDGPVLVTGRLLGRRDDARLDEAIPPGETRRIQLTFPPEVPRPGTHALTLLVSYSAGGAAASRCAFLLLGIGAAPDPAVRLFPGEAAFELRGPLQIGLESADGAPHEVKLSVETPRGLSAGGLAVPVRVPATGRVVARVDLRRTGAAHDTRHGLLVIAEAADGPEARTTVATATARVLSDPAVLPRIRTPLVAAALLLLLASLGVELRHYLRPAP